MSQIGHHAHRLCRGPRARNRYPRTDYGHSHPPLRVHPRQNSALFPDRPLRCLRSDIALTAFAVVREREIGPLEQIMVTPIRPFEFILGKTLPFFLIGLFDVSLIATVGTLWFQVPFRGHISVLLAGSVLFILCMLGAGLLISTVSATQQQAMVTAFFLIMPGITFSGFGFPIATMPQWLQIGRASCRGRE